MARRGPASTPRGQFRSRCPRTWGFESPRSHHPLTSGSALHLPSPSGRACLIHHPSWCPTPPTASPFVLADACPLRARSLGFQRSPTVNIGRRTRRQPGCQFSIPGRASGMDAPSKLVIPLGSLDGLSRGTAVATTVSTCQVVQEDTRLRAAGSASRRAAGRPSPLRTAPWAWTTYFRPASRAAPPTGAWYRGGGGPM